MAVVVHDALTPPTTIVEYLNDRRRPYIEFHNMVISG